MVGVGSVGTVCLVLLFMAGEDDPLFLQVKEARASVLEPYAGASVFAESRPAHRARLPADAARQRHVPRLEPRDRSAHFFVRQLRDMKLSLMVETFGQAEMTIYAGWCGRALALSHARSGSASMLSGYMGKSDAFDRAIASFAMAYADQNEKDHAALERAVRDGKVKAVFEEAK